MWLAKKRGKVYTHTRPRGVRTPQAYLAYAEETGLERDPKAAQAAISALREAAQNDKNTMPAFMACAHAYCTLGEQMDVLREVYGVYQEPVLI